MKMTQFAIGVLAFIGASSAAIGEARLRLVDIEHRWTDFCNSNLLAKRDSMTKVRAFVLKEVGSLSDDDLKGLVIDPAIKTCHVSPYIRSYAIEKAVAKCDVKLLEALLVQAPVSFVWGQRLDYFLAASQNGKMFTCLFSAYRIAKKDGNSEIAGYLLDVIADAFPELQFTKEEGADAFIEKAANYYPKIKPELKLNENSVQISISNEMSKWGLLDFTRHQKNIRERYPQ